MIFYNNFSEKHDKKNSLRLHLNKKTSCTWIGFVSFRFVLLRFSHEKLCSIVHVHVDCLAITKCMCVLVWMHGMELLWGRCHMTNYNVRCEFDRYFIVELSEHGLEIFIRFSIQRCALTVHMECDYKHEYGRHLVWGFVSSCECWPVECLVCLYNIQFCWVGSLLHSSLLLMFHSVIGVFVRFTGVQRYQRFAHTHIFVFVSCTNKLETIESVHLQHLKRKAVGAATKDREFYVCLSDVFFFLNVFWSGVV